MGADNPYLPVYLPEFDASVSWAMCRNSMCANFGIRFEGEAPGGQRTISDGRCEIDTEGGRCPRGAF